MTDVIAYTKYGKVLGDYFDGVYRFLGIRYAKAPVGELRFQPPQPPEVSPVIMECKKYAYKCYQTDTPRIEVPEVANSPYNIIIYSIMIQNNAMLFKNMRYIVSWNITKVYLGCDKEPIYI